MRPLMERQMLMGYLAQASEEVNRTQMATLAKKALASAKESLAQAQARENLVQGNALSGLDSAQVERPQLEFPPPPSKGQHPHPQTTPHPHPPYRSP